MLRRSPRPPGERFRRPQVEWAFESPAPQLVGTPRLAPARASPRRDTRVAVGARCFTALPRSEPKTPLSHRVHGCCLRLEPGANDRLGPVLAVAGVKRVLRLRRQACPETGHPIDASLGEDLLYMVKGGGLRPPPAPAAGGRKRPSSPAPHARSASTENRAAANAGPLAERAPPSSPAGAIAAPHARRHAWPSSSAPDRPERVLAAQRSAPRCDEGAGMPLVWVGGAPLPLPRASWRSPRGLSRGGAGGP
jgi:hypothetical protein